VTDRGHLVTERADPRSAALDTLSTRAALALFAQADREAAAAVAAAHAELAAAVELVAARLAGGGRLVYAGAGTSGRLAVLDAAECPPTFRSAPEQVQAVIAGGPPALRAAVEGAEDDAAQGAADLAARGVGERDAVLGITAGGTTPYVHGALGEARRRGAATLFLACVPRAEVDDDYDVSLRLVCGPELVAGSTRLKAGTATKLALNALSTLVMVRLGKVHGNLMVDVDTSANAKLVDRGERLVMQIARVDRARAAGLLERAGGRVKVAALMGVRGVDAAHAEARLARAGGMLRVALEEG
jgi:N-acetylmuramic acid 6-phosphate etherase